MKNVILGGAGFIGSNLCEELLKTNEKIFIIDKLDKKSFRFISDKSVEYLQCEITNTKKLLEAFRSIEPDRVFHLAANSDIKVSSEKPIYDVRDTFLTTAALVQVAAEFTLRNVFFASSSAVYGPKNNVINENEERNPISAYGWMKFSSEEILMQSVRSKSIQQLMIYRFPNVVGKYMTHGVVYDLINKLIKNNHKLEVLGNGNQKKPYMLADELCKLIILGQSKNINNIEILNISSEKTITVAEIVDIICNEMRLNPQLIFGNSPEGWKGDVPNYQLNIEKSRELLGIATNVSSTSSIKTSVNAYLGEVGWRNIE